MFSKVKQNKVNNITFTHLAYLSTHHKVSNLGFPEASIFQKAVMLALQGEKKLKKIIIHNKMNNRYQHKPK
jgi:hypothetical protein